MPGCVTGYICNKPQNITKRGNIRLSTALLSIALDAFKRESSLGYSLHHPHRPDCRRFETPARSRCRFRYVPRVHLSPCHRGQLRAGFVEPHCFPSLWMPSSENPALAIACITQPSVAVFGGMYLVYIFRHVIEVSYELDSWSYSMPPCNTLYCGTFPCRATLGWTRLSQAFIFSACSWTMLRPHAKTANSLPIFVSSGNPRCWLS